MPVKGMWLTCQRIIITLLSHSVTTVTVSCLNWSLDGCQVPSKCHAAQFVHHGMAWKLDIGGVFYVVIIPYF